jgi:hypothetical protein
MGWFRVKYDRESGSWRSESVTGGGEDSGEEEGSIGLMVWY